MRGEQALALGSWTLGPGGSARGVRQGCCDTATGACDTAGPLPRHGREPGHDTATMRAPGSASAHLGVPAGSVGCLCVRLSFSNWFSTRYFFPESLNEHCSL